MFDITKITDELIKNSLEYKISQNLSFLSSESADNSSSTFEKLSKHKTVQLKMLQKIKTEICIKL